MPFPHAFAGGIVLSMLAVGGLAARQETPQARFSSQVQLVEVYATVIDSKGEPVTGLSRDDFEVYEDGTRQEISAFAAGEFPLTAVLGVDRSWSMAGDRLRLAKQASQSFIRALRPDDRTMVMAINNEAEIVAPLTMDRAGQIRAIERLDPWSTTALHDSLITALDRLEGETGRQAIVVFSDGADRYSHASPADVIERARRSNSLIYPIGLGRERPAVLAELAVVTGGRSFLLRDVKELDKTLTEIARELRQQYLIGYTPSPVAGGASGWRSIRVTTRTPGLRVRARDGYMSNEGDLH
ncbi:MAG: VWA domain-containing protein [Acidobacteria bacterium]|nr:VWA domain-containing protein [Acidobacteriota bacterium]